MTSVLDRLIAAAYRLVSTRIVVLNPNIAVEDIPRRQALLAGALPSAGQRCKPAKGFPREQIKKVIFLRGVRHGALN